jgi:hypothetical protein
VGEESQVKRLALLFFLRTTDMTEHFIALAALLLIIYGITVDSFALSVIGVVALVVLWLLLWWEGRR